MKLAQQSGTYQGKQSAVPAAECTSCITCLPQPQPQPPQRTRPATGRIWKPVARCSTALRSASCGTWSGLNPNSGQQRRNCREGGREVGV